MTAEIISIKEPRALAGLAARLPAVFLPDEEVAERFLVSSLPTFATLTLGGRTTKRRAGSRTGARPGVLHFT